MARLAWIAPGSPPDSFPDPRLALREPEGLLAAGGDLSPARLLAAYRRGIFPWYQAGQPVLWWSPDPRAVLFPEHFHLARRLRRRLRSLDWQVSVDQDFAPVIEACATSRGDTWLVPAMRQAYRRLAALGHAHSIEVSAQGHLVGGLYGVALGQVFFAESMFSHETDASKLALLKLCQLCVERGIRLVDCQMPTPHLLSLGVQCLPRERFLALLETAVTQPCQAPWPEAAAPVAALAHA
jgi:leucyl/phenylalanyl-tRNA---protein transferase